MNSLSSSSGLSSWFCGRLMSTVTWTMLRFVLQKPGSGCFLSTLCCWTSIPFRSAYRWTWSDWLRKLPRHIPSLLAILSPRSRPPIPQHPPILPVSQSPPYSPVVGIASGVRVRVLRASPRWPRCQHHRWMNLLGESDVMLNMVVTHWMTVWHTARSACSHVRCLPRGSL